MLYLRQRGFETPYETISFANNPTLPLRAKKFNPRTRFPRAIVLHTVHGRLGKTLPGSRSSLRAEAYGKYQRDTKRMVSWDFTIDTDGTVVQHNDPAETYTWHATSWNPFSIGIEMVQESNGDLYQVTIDTLVLLLDDITRELGIQRQIPMRDGKVIPGVLSRADEKGSKKGADLVGIFAHHHNTKKRGMGDPGLVQFEALLAAGYEPFDMEPPKNEEAADIRAWKSRQQALGLTGKNVDGIPGPGTVRALEAAGHKHGLWISRPSD